MVDFIAVGLSELTADLSAAGGLAGLKAVKAAGKAGLSVKNDAVRFATGISHAPHYPRSISYDVDVRGTSIVVEVGPDKDRPQGALGNILEYGTVNNAPRTHLGPALDRELPNWIEALEGIVGDVL